MAAEKQKRPTIRMVAERAQVSRGTVDRVLNNRSYVKDEVRVRVLDAIRDLGYGSPRENHIQKLSALLEPLKLGVLLPNWGGYFRDEIDSGIQRASRDLGEFHTEIALRRCRTDIPAEAIDLLEELVNEGCKGLAVCGETDPAIQQRLAALGEAGIPCITFNSDLPESGRLCFIGEDIDQAGRVAGELMGKCVPSDGQILAMVGNLKFDGHRRRLEGFCKRLAELGFGEDQILIAETFNDYAMTRQIVEETLLHNEDLRGIYMANLSITACAEAVHAAGKTGQIRIVCHDVDESTRQLLQSGRVDFAIPQDMEQQGYMPLILLRELLQKGMQPTSDRFETRITVVCRENL